MQMIIDALWRDGLQTRVALDEQTVREYAEAMREGAQFPPVKVFEEPCAGAYYLADGFHRVEAALRAGRDEIDADVERGTFVDALRYALGCNARHGKRVTNEDKRRAMELAWDNRAELFGGDPSTALLATTCGVHRNTAQQFLAEKTPMPVAPVRPACPQGAQNVQPEATPAPTPAPVRVGTDGKVYPVRPTRPQPPTVVVPKDRFGVYIPKPIEEAFGADVLADVLASISAARCAIRHGLEDKDARFAAVRQDALVNLDNAYNFVASATPFCVCRVCKGTGGGCRACHGRGWQTEEEYRRNPKELQA